MNTLLKLKNPHKQPSAVVYKFPNRQAEVAANAAPAADMGCRRAELLFNRGQREWT